MPADLNATKDFIPEKHKKRPTPDIFRPPLRETQTAIFQYNFTSN